MHEHVAKASEKSRLSSASIDKHTRIALVESSDRLSVLP